MLASGYQLVHLLLCSGNPELVHVLYCEVLLSL